MSFFDYFRSKRSKSAGTAKERLKIIVAHERSLTNNTADFIPRLKQDLMEVIRKYVEIEPEHVQVNLDQKDGELSVLELNVILPDEQQSSQDSSAQSASA